jgi:hypothetical protein
MVTSEWTPEEFRRLREILRRPGVVTLHLWPEAPELAVTLDLSGIGPLILAGKISNRLLAALDGEINAAAEQALAKPAEEQDPYELIELTNKIMQRQDYILAAVIVKPKYYMLDQLPPGGQPEDGLCIHDFTPDMRLAILEVLNKGVDELAKFRADPVGYATALAERTARDAAERAHLAAGNAVVGQDGVRPGDLVAGVAARTTRARTRVAAGARARE